MKRIKPSGPQFWITLFLIGSTLSFILVQTSGKGNCSDPEIKLNYNSFDTSVDSLTHCWRFSERTRYWSTFNLEFSVLGLDEGINPGESFLITFDLDALLPGSPCRGNVIPHSNLATNLTEGFPLETLWSEVDHISGVPVGNDARITASVQMEMKYNESTHQAKGGLCIILETIDPRTPTVPRLDSLYHPKLISSDEKVWEMEAVSPPEIYPNVILPEPEAPNCIACLPENGRDS